MKKSCLTCDWCRETNVIKYKFYCDLKHSFVTHTFLKVYFADIIGKYIDENILNIFKNP